MAEEQPIKWERLESQYHLAFEVAQKRLEGQEEAFDVVRGRAVQLITVVSAATAFVAGIVLRDDKPGLGWLTLVAVVLYLGTVAVCLGILRAVAWRSRPKATDVIDSYIERRAGPAGMAEMYRGMAVDMETAWEDNQPTLVNRLGWLQIAIFLTVATVAVWLAALLSSQ